MVLAESEVNCRSVAFAATQKRMQNNQPKLRSITKPESELNRSMIESELVGAGDDVGARSHLLLIKIQSYASKHSLLNVDDMMISMRRSGELN